MSLPILCSGVVWLSHLIWVQGIVGSNHTCAIKELFCSQFFFNKDFSLLVFGRWIDVYLPLLSGLVVHW